MRDITSELNDRLAKLQAEAEDIARKRQELDAEERDIQHRIQALKTTMEWERVLQGKSNGKTQWGGMGIAEAVKQLQEEHPRWGHSEIRDRLIADGFDFKGKNPGLSVNQALIRMRRGAKR